MPRESYRHFRKKIGFGRIKSRKNGKGKRCDLFPRKRAQTVRSLLLRRWIDSCDRTLFVNTVQYSYDYLCTLRYSLNRVSICVVPFLWLSLHCWLPETDARNLDLDLSRSLEALTYQIRSWGYANEIITYEQDTSK